MTALWISLAAAVALLITWRLRRAANVLDRILREERERPAEDPVTNQESHAEQHKT